MLRVCVTSACGFVALGVAWYAISGLADPAAHGLWLNVGVGGTVISALGNGVWLLRGRRAIGKRRVELVSLQHDPLLAESMRMGELEDTLTMPVGTVRVEGMNRVHQADCPLIAGKRWQSAAPGEGEPCGVCAP